MKIAIPLGTLGLVLCCAPIAFAELKDEPFGLRSSLALDRISSYTDVLARQASVAHPLGSSVNPASPDVLRETPFDMNAIVSLTTNQVLFESGAWLTGFSANGAVRFPDAGTLTVNYIRTDTQDNSTRTTDAYALRSNGFSMSYAHRLNKAFSIGGGLAFEEGTFSSSYMTPSPLSPTGFFPVDVDSKSFTGSASLGVWTALSEQLFLGVTGGVGVGTSHTEGFVILPAPFPSQRIDNHDTLRSRSIRAGVGYKPLPELGLYADVVYLHFESVGDSNAGSVDTVKGLAGVEWFPIDRIALRAGGSIDRFNNATVSAGIGIYLIPRVPIDIGYHFNAFPEVHNELGKAHLVSASVVFVF